MYSIIKTFKMFSTTTFGIKVSVTPQYDSKNSFPAENRFVFRYNITIENVGRNAIQVLSRKWLIFDLGFGFTEVAGDGVIGLTPIIEAGDNFTYFSNVLLRSGVGNMSGIFFCKSLLTNKTLEIEVPKFNLVAEVLSN